MEDVRRAAGLGFVAGITTNPGLIARAGRPAEESIPELCNALGAGLVFHQLVAPTVAEREVEARCFSALRPGRVGLKIPCTTENLALLHCLASDGIACAITAIFSAHQACMACEAGADYLILYINRSTRLQGDGIALVKELVTVVQATGGRTERDSRIDIRQFDWADVCRSCTRAQDEDLRVAKTGIIRESPVGSG